MDMKTFPCPLPVFKEVHDDHGGSKPKIEPCGEAVCFHVVDGGTFYDDFEEATTAPMWEVQCEAGHVLGMNYDESDVPASTTAYIPEVGHEIWEGTFYFTPAQRTSLRAAIFTVLSEGLDVAEDWALYELVGGDVEAAKRLLLPTEGSSS